MGTHLASCGARRRRLGRAARALHLMGIITALCVERVTAGYEGVFCRFFAYIYTTYCDARVM